MADEFDVSFYQYQRLNIQDVLISFFELKFISSFISCQLVLRELKDLSLVH